MLWLIEKKGAYVIYEWSPSKNSHVVTTWSHEWLIEDFFRREEAVGSAIQTKFAVAVLDNKNTKFETVWRVKL